jgi:hypothetical protein
LRDVGIKVQIRALKANGQKVANEIDGEKAMKADKKPTVSLD